MISLRKTLQGLCALIPFCPRRFTGAPSILVVEDEHFLSQMYKIQLEEEHYDVRIVLNGKEALKAIEKREPDLLLLDLLMPIVDGFDVLKAIQEKGYTFPVVVLSNLSMEEDREKCKKLGATDYLLKSDMTTDQLAVKIKEYL